MTQFLPPNLLALFAPRDPIPYLPPAERLPYEKKTKGYFGVGSYLHLFEDPKDTPPPTRIETRDERIERKKREKAEQAAYRLEQGIALWDPLNNSTATSDPYKTLFVARVNYDTSESKMRREFEAYGAIKKVVIVQDKVTGKPRGFAFIEYEHERDMHAAYKHADGGGLGGTRRGGPDQNAKHSGREDSNRFEDGSRDRERGFEPRTTIGRDRERKKERSRSRERDRERRRRSRSPRERTRDRERSDRNSDRSDRRRQRRDSSFNNDYA